MGKIQFLQLARELLLPVRAVLLTRSARQHR